MAAGGLAKLKLEMEIDGDKVVVTGLERVDQSIDRTAQKTKTATEQMATGMNTASTATGRMAADMSGLETVIQRVVAAWGTWELLKAGQDAVMFAASVQQADRALGVIGNTTGHTVAEMYKYRDAVRDLNITTSTATNSTAQFARAQLPLEKLKQLATGAQGAAIAYSMMGGEVISSSQALDKIVRAILTLQTVELHQMGIMVSQREILRENGMGISEHQRKQELLTKVLEQLTPLNTLYAESMDLASKKIASSKRPVEELKLALGQLFLPQLNVAATFFYDTVSGGMKWVRAHNAELATTKNIIWDLTDAAKVGSGFIAAYFLAFGGYTLVTNASAALILLRAASIDVNTALSLTGGIATATATQIGLMGETTTVATTTATAGVLSLRVAFSSLFAFIAGYQFGKWLYNEFEVVRNAGTHMVWGLMRGWGEFVYVLQEAKSILSNMFDQDEMDTQLQKINAEREKWRQEWRQSKADQLADNARLTATGAPAGRQYTDNAAAIAAGLEAERQKKAQEAAEANRQAKDLAEKQARYDKQVVDAKYAVVKQYDDNERRLLDAQTKEKLTQLEYEKEMGLRTVQSFLNEKYVMELQNYAKERDAASKQVTALQTTLNAMKVNPAVDTVLFKQEELKLAQAKGALAILEDKLKGLGPSQQREQGKNDYTQTKQLAELNVQLLDISGHYEQAARAKAAMEKETPGYKGATAEIQKQKDAIAAWNIEEARRKDLITQISATIAALENQLTSIDQAEKTYALTHAEAAYARINLYQQELVQQQLLFDSITGTEPATIQLRQQTLDKITQINGKLLDQQKILSESTFLGGATSALQEYTRMAMDTGTQTRNMVTSMLKGMEDALVKFVTTGRLEFKELTKSIIADLARIAIQRALASGLGMIGTSLFGTAAIAGTAATAGAAATGGTAATAGLLGAGGVAAAMSAFGGGIAAGWGAGIGAINGAGVGGMAGAGISVGAAATVVVPLAVAAAATYIVAKYGFGWGNGWQSTGTGFDLNISNTGQISGQTWEEFKKKGGWFTSSRYRTEFKALTDAQSIAIQQSFDVIQEALKLDAAILGNAAAMTTQQLSSITMQTNRFKTVADFLKAYALQSTQDLFAGFGRWEEQFHEEYRAIYSTTTMADDVPVQIGYEIVRISDGMKFITSALVRSGETVTDARTRIATSLNTIRMFFEYAGQHMRALTYSEALQTGDIASTVISKLQAMTGGEANKTDTAQSALSAYVGSTLFTEKEKAANNLNAAMLQVNTTFAALGIAVPRTNAEFKELVNSTLAVALAGGEGADAASTLWSQLVRIAPTFGTVTASVQTMVDATTEASKKLVDTAKKNLTDSISTSTSLLNSLKTILTGPLANLSPEAAYLQAKAQFANAGASNAGERGTALLEASRSYYASGSGYQSDLAEVTARLGQLSNTAPTLSFVEQQIKLLGEIKAAIDSGSTATVQALGVTFNAAQIDMGLANNQLSLALQSIQSTLNTPITAGTAKPALEAQIAALQIALNNNGQPLTGSAADAVNSAIAGLQLAMNGTISSASASQAIAASYSIVQGALNGTINGSVAANGIAAQYAVIQAAANGAITGGQAAATLGQQYAIIQAAADGTITGSTAAVALQTQYATIQAAANGTITGSQAAASLAAQYGIIQLAANGGISAATAQQQIQDQYAAVTSALGTGVSGALSSVSDALADFNTAITAQSAATATGLARFVTAMEVMQTYPTQLNNYNALRNQYTSGTIGVEAFAAQAAGMYGPLNDLYTRGVNAGLTTLTAPTAPAITTAMDNMRMQAKAAAIADEAMKMSVGLLPQNLKYDLAPYYNGAVHADGIVDAGDASVWNMISQGILKWSDVGLPAFGSGTAGLDADGPIYAHKYEKIIDPTSSQILSRYGIKVSGGDNRELIEEIKALKAEVIQLRKESVGKLTDIESPLRRVAAAR